MSPNTGLDPYEALIRERDHLKKEIDKLADFILKEVPGEPREGSAVDCAIRTIRNYQQGIQNLAAQLSR